jgi:predicted Rossmann fold flavoprotein
MTAIACARQAPDARIACVDGARSPGAKILVSGGSRCNVTNRVVTERDFWGGSSRVVRDVLRAFPASRAAAFFEELGVELREEPDGKLFPVTDRARTVLDALLREMKRVRVDLLAGHRVTAIERVAQPSTAAVGDSASFAIHTSHGVWNARCVVLATGGRSLPKSGSDGFGYELARRLGHGHVETTPALAPLILMDHRLRELTGVSHSAAVSIHVNGRSTRLRGSLLWTHFGASGPVILNASRHWARAVLEQRPVDVLVNILPDDTFESLDDWLLHEAREHPRTSVAKTLAQRLPAAVAATWVEAAGVSASDTMAHLARDARRALVRGLVETRLEVRDTRGYTYAEVTAGGVPLDEIDSATMESRVCPGLFLVGEILDVDGRIGGFNFQWAWSSGWVAGRAMSDMLRTVPRGPR